MQGTPYPQLAKEFMDLWQKQLSSVTSDKQFINAMLELFQSMQAPKTNDTRANTTAESAPTSDAEHGVLAELAFRVAMCEKRLAALEKSGDKPPRTGNRTGSKKPRK